MTVTPNSNRYGRRSVLAGATAAELRVGGTKAQPSADHLFDSHFHIIDPKFPLVANQGYLPPPYSVSTYLAAARPLGVTAGAVVSGSFQGFDQSYLRAALDELGPGWFGVTQVPPNIGDEALIDLTHAGVHALRFNMYRGQIDDVEGEPELIWGYALSDIGIGLAYFNIPLGLAIITRCRDLVFRPIS